MIAARSFQAQNLPRVEYRYILRSREGATLLRPDGRPYVYPSYMAALRGAAMIDDRAVVIQQEKFHEI